MKYVQPEVKVLFDKEWDKEHETGMYDTCMGLKAPLWMRLKYARKKQDERDEERRQRDLANVCPTCHMVLPFSLVCDMCGTDYNENNQ